MGATAPFWRFSADSYPDLDKSTSEGALEVKANRTLNGDAGTASRVWLFFCSFSIELISYMRLISLQACIVI